MLVLGGCKLKSYVHVQGGGCKFAKSERTSFTDDPLAINKMLQKLRVLSAKETFLTFKVSLEMFRRVVKINILGHSKESVQVLAFHPSMVDHMSTRNSKGTNS